MARDADALLVLTKWEEFRQPDWDAFMALIARPLVIDGRNLLEPQKMKELGFENYSFGGPMDNLTSVVVPAQVQQ